MITRREAIAALAATLALACGRVERIDRAPPISVGLVEPWTDMELPVPSDPGAPAADPNAPTVVFVNERMLTVEYASGSVEGLTQTWANALRRQGWARKEDTSSADTTSMSFVKNEATLALGVFAGISSVAARRAEGRTEESDRFGGLTVTLTLFDPEGT